MYVHTESRVNFTGELVSKKKRLDMYAKKGKTY